MLPNGKKDPCLFLQDRALVKPGCSRPVLPDFSTEAQQELPSPLPHVY